MRYSRVFRSIQHYYAEIPDLRLSYKQHDKKYSGNRSNKMRTNLLTSSLIRPLQNQAIYDQDQHLHHICSSSRPCAAEGQEEV